MPLKRMKIIFFQDQTLSRIFPYPFKRSRSVTCWAPPYHSDSSGHQLTVAFTCWSQHRGNSPICHQHSIRSHLPPLLLNGASLLQPFIFQQPHWTALFGSGLIFLSGQDFQDKPRKHQPRAEDPLVLLGAFAQGY